MRERTSLDELQLQGSPNLRRAQNREASEANASLTPETRTEVEQLNELIEQAMSACRRGQTFKGRPNPAFEHLTKLIKVRDLLMRGKKPKKSSADILAEANKVLGMN